MINLDNKVAVIPDAASGINGADWPGWRPT